LDAGDEVLEDCEVGCTACGKCAMDGGDLITMKGNLPKINYSLNHRVMAPIQRCPTGSIVWLDDQGAKIKGAESKHVVRISDIEMGES
jgi:ferredoxin